MENIKTASGSDLNNPKMTFEEVCVEIFTCIGVISALVNLLLVFVIIKFKKLRQDPTNQIFLHVNILQVVFFIFLPLQLRYLGLSKNPGDDNYHNIFCFFFQINSCVLFGLGALSLLLISDSQLKIYHQDKYQKFIKSYKYIFIAIYVLIVLLSAATFFVSMFLVEFAVTPVALLVLVIIFTLVLITINIVHGIKKRKLTNYNSSNIGLVILNILLVFMTPFIVVILICTVGHNEIIINACYILGLLPLLTPIFNLIYVYFYDKTYNLCLRSVFNCRNNQSEDIDQPVAYHIVPNGVKVDQ